MTDDRDTTGQSGGFDDWLDDDPGPVTDPYKVLASEDPEEEIAEWMEFTDQKPEPGDQIPEPGTATADTGPDDGEADETAEIEAVPVDESPPEQEDEAPPGDDETHELDEDHEDTGELEIVKAADAEPVTEEHPLDLDDDHTDELVPVAAVGFGELWDDEDSDPTDSASEDGGAEPFDISRDDYLNTATKEHEGLAESIAAADDEDTEQVALAAPIPGLDAAVVGFEDVVEAEGHGKVRARASGDLIARVITAVVLIVAVGASLWWKPALVALALVVFVVGSGEFYTALTRSGRKPIALFGFIGIIGASLGAFFAGPLWIPLAFVFAATLLLLFYAVVPGKADPMSNLALTITVMVWAGLGAFAMPIIESDSYRILVFGIVAAVALMDIAQYFFGRALGRHQLSPWVSPKKTVEGLVAGIVVALTVGALLHFLEPFELTSGLAIGAAVAVLAPLGDLAMSAAKRSLGLKDMGSVLPGHGGFMDRIDGLLFVIPAAWAIFLWTGIL